MSQRILLVEDDDSLRTIAQLTLTELGGYDVLALSSGKEAIAQAQGFRPDMLVLDVSMPGMDGPQTLAHLRALDALQHVPVVFLTANTRASQVAQFRDMGAVDVIAKPFDPRGLCDRIARALAASPQATIPAPLESTRPPMALIVEDDPGIRYILSFILEQQGWQVMEAHDGPQGVAAILDGPLADAVVLDIMLPGVDGLELLRILRGVSRWKTVPVMMLTAKGDETSVSRALDLGADDYLGKPFDPAELVTRLNRLPRPRRA